MPYITLVSGISLYKRDDLALRLDNRVCPAVLSDPPTRDWVAASFAYDKMRRSMQCGLLAHMAYAIFVIRNRPMTWHDAAHVGIGHRPKASKTSLVGHKAGAPVVPANFYQCQKQTLETLETKGLGVCLWNLATSRAWHRYAHCG